MYIVKKDFLYSNESGDNLFFEFISNKFGSLRKFAKYLNLSPAYVSSFLNGKKPIPIWVLNQLKLDFNFSISFCLY